MTDAKVSTVAGVTWALTTAIVLQLAVSELFELRGWPEALATLVTAFFALELSEWMAQLFLVGDGRAASLTTILMLLTLAFAAATIAVAFTVSVYELLFAKSLIAIAALMLPSVYVVGVVAVEAKQQRAPHRWACYGVLLIFMSLGVVALFAPDTSFQPSKVPTVPTAGLRAVMAACAVQALVGLVGCWAPVARRRHALQMAGVVTAAAGAVAMSENSWAGLLLLGWAAYVMSLAVMESPEFGEPRIGSAGA